MSKKLDKETLMQVAEVELRYKTRKKTSVVIKGAEDCEKVLRSVWYDDMEVRERMYAVFLSRRNHVMAVQELSAGGTDATTIDVKILFATAVKMLASGMILAHNHPSGTTDPSIQDRNLTKKVKDCCTLMDMVLLDHIILTTDSIFSFANEGIL